jgi:hypothetical protein
MAVQGYPPKEPPTAVPRPRGKPSDKESGPPKRAA